MNKKVFAIVHQKEQDVWVGKRGIFRHCSANNFFKQAYFGLKFYQRLSALGPTYPENFSPFGRSWAKIDF